MRYFNHQLFRSASITARDYVYLTWFTAANNVQRVLEFGPGISTYAFLESDCSVESFEHHPKYYVQQHEHFAHSGEVRVHLYQHMPVLVLPQLKGQQFDMAFVDGPPGSAAPSRMNACAIAAAHSSVFLLHDCKRAAEQATIEEFARQGWKTRLLVSDRGIGICWQGNIEIPAYDVALLNATISAERNNPNA